MILLTATIRSVLRYYSRSAACAPALKNSKSEVSGETKIQRSSIDGKSRSHDENDGQTVIPSISQHSCSMLTATRVMRYQGTEVLSGVFALNSDSICVYFFIVNEAVLVDSRELWM